MANGKILLIGDAAGFFDPITGESIDFAARQALLLEKYVEPVLKENSGNFVKAMFDYSRASAQNLSTISYYDQFGTVNSLMAKVDGWCDSGFAFVSSIVSKTAVCQYALTF